MYGDVRDFLYAVYQYDTIGAAITGFGLVPYLGDCEKTAVDVAKYLLKYPDNVLDVAKYLVDQHVLEILPSEGQLNVIDHFYLFATGRKVATELKAEYVLTEAQIAKMLDRKVELDKVIRVVKVGDDAIPLTEASRGHYVGRHVDGTEGVRRDGTTLFPTSEPVTSYGIPYPGTSSLTREQMKAKIIDWIGEVLPEKLTEWPVQKTPVEFIFPEERYGIRVITIGVDKSGAYTVFPKKGSQVYMWHSEQWNLMPYIEP